MSVLRVSGPGGGSVSKHFTLRGPTGWLRCPLRPAGVVHGQAWRRRDGGGAGNLGRPIKAAARGCAGLGLLGARDVSLSSVFSPPVSRPTRTRDAGAALRLPLARPALRPALRAAAPPRGPRLQQGRRRPVLFLFLREPARVPGRGRQRKAARPRGAGAEGRCRPKDS
ncbi:uncharacterized protein [Gorilla gorilla gorilla]|uniref:uncharacterized protein n=1 Tax=Gorilla gorilla gorilla TaxID=9595 RepID=UPI00244656F6|nr:uncharacterized protein LOC115932634 [Gorilla gorilla gorilla]